MPIPTSYTYETARDFIENEILQGTAEAMGWKDDTSASNVAVTLAGTKPINDRWLNLTSPLTHFVPAGTKIRTTFVNGTTGFSDYLTTSYDAYEGEQKIFTEADMGSVARTVNTVVTIPTGGQSVDAQDVYDSITNEALLFLGRTTPESVLASEIEEFRLLLRIEAWRAVAYNSLTDFDMGVGDSQLFRSHINVNAVEQLSLAETEYESKYPFIEAPVRMPRARTYSGGVTVRW